MTIPPRPYPIDPAASQANGWWVEQAGEGPVIATAIHDGNCVRGEVRSAMKIADPDRLREEDPFTGQAIIGVANHIVGLRSRFEVDINRGADGAVYRTPEQSWGLEVWHAEPSDALVERSMDIHRAYYANLGDRLDRMLRAHDRVVLLDVHSYNHRRAGPDGDPTPQDEAPDINIGTSSMPREYWADALDPIMDAMRGYDFNGRNLDVRENVAFQGKGEQTRFVHERYPEKVCGIAIEFKKFFMDEWTGEPRPDELAAMRGFIDHAAAAAREALK